MNAEKVLFQLEDKNMWDFWYIKAADTYHAFYLQYPKNADKQFMFVKTSVGHAISKDLINWREEDTALEPAAGTWNDLGIATGSTVYKDGKYYMIFTGNSTFNTGGMGLAESADLLKWHKVGDKPVIPRPSYYSALWKGKELKCYPLADPYIYPETIDEWHYLVINSQVVGVPEGKRGCQLMLKSKDLLEWEPHKIVVYPGCFERMETAQIWEYNGRWYMIFGGVPGFGSYVYMSESFDGPYEPQEWSRLQLPDGCGFYLGKIVKDSNGRSIFLANDCLLDKKRLIGPYAICYDHNNGKVSIYDCNNL